jgi:hypothetical protein
LSLIRSIARHLDESAIAAAHASIRAFNRAAETLPSSEDLAYTSRICRRLRERMSEERGDLKSWWGNFQRVLEYGTRMGWHTPDRPITDKQNWIYRVTKCGAALGPVTWKILFWRLSMNHDHHGGRATFRGIARAIDGDPTLTESMDEGEVRDAFNRAVPLFAELLRKEGITTRYVETKSEAVMPDAQRCAVTERGQECPVGAVA